MKLCERCNENLPIYAFKRSESTVCNLCKIIHRKNKLTARIENTELLSLEELTADKVIVEIIGSRRQVEIPKSKLLHDFEEDEIYVIQHDLVIVKAKKPTRKSSNIVVEQIKRENNYRCIYCGGVADTIDHYIPLSKGGTWDHDNLKASCFHCNEIKNDYIFNDIEDARNYISLGKKEAKRRKMKKKKSFKRRWSY